MKNGENEKQRKKRRGEAKEKIRTTSGEHCGADFETS